MMTTSCGSGAPAPPRPLASAAPRPLGDDLDVEPVGRERHRQFGVSVAEAAVRADGGPGTSAHRERLSPQLTEDVSVGAGETATGAAGRRRGMNDATTKASSAAPAPIDMTTLKPFSDGRA